MREAVARDLGALRRLGVDERALQDRLDEIADAFGGPGRLRRIAALGGFDVGDQHGDVRRHALLAGGANVGVGRVGLLHQRAEQAGVVGQFALQDLGAEIDVAEQALQRVVEATIRRGGEEALGHFVPERRGRQREIVLAFEVVEEAALGDARGVADVVDRGRRIAALADHMQRRVEQLQLGLVRGAGGHYCSIPICWYLVNTDSTVCYSRPHCPFAGNEERSRRGASHANVDQNAARHSGGARGRGRRRRRRAHRRTRRARRRAGDSGRCDPRRQPACGAAGAGQCASSFLPDADPRPSRGDQPGAVPLAEVALSDLGAAVVPTTCASPRGWRWSNSCFPAARPPPTTIISTPAAWKTPSTSRPKRRARSACA